MFRRISGVTIMASIFDIFSYKNFYERDSSYKIGDGRDKGFPSKNFENQEINTAYLERASKLIEELQKERETQRGKSFPEKMQRRGGEVSNVLEQAKRDLFKALDNSPQ